MDQFDKMLAKWQPAALSLLRFITGLLLFQFGVAKILKFPVIPDGNAYAFLNKVQMMSLGGAAGTLELILGALLLLGLFTRPVAFILAGEMAFAYFMGHAPPGAFFRSSTAARSRSCSASPASICDRWRRAVQPRRHGAKEGVTAFNPSLRAKRSNPSWTRMDCFVAKPSPGARSRDPWLLAMTVTPALSIPTAPRPRISSCAAPATF